MPELTNLEKIRRLPWQYGGNAANVIFWFTAAYGSVFTLFLNEVGFDKARIGFLISLLPFCGPLALVAAPFAQRFGFKRTFLTFYTLRKFCAALLLLTPLIMGYFGRDVTFLWVAAAVLAFAICRATAETALYPWSQEMIPDSFRGKFSAISNIISMFVSMLTIGIAGLAIRRWESLNTFVVLMSCGIVAGLISAWCFSFVPGGAPQQHRGSRAHYRGMWLSLFDTNYRKFMIGLGMISFATTSLAAFAPLYFKEKIGLPAGMVVWMDIGNFTGSLISCYLWGWAADRYGSKPVMLLGGCLWSFFPILCFVMPRGMPISPMFAAGAMFLLGVANLAWAIGLNRYLFVSAVPPDKKTQYLAVFYAGAGLANGLGPLICGFLLKQFDWISSKVFIFHIDSYTVLFFVSGGLIFAGALVLSYVRSDGAMPMKKFVSMFLQGNPLMAANSVWRYYRAANEESRVLLTERMGYSNNPLSTNELIEALHDPSFNVRYEAIIAIAHMRPSPELVDALLLVLGGNEPDLSSHAAWALGKLGDKSALIGLREMLNSDQPLLRARCARALATLGDNASIPEIISHFKRENNPGLKIAYAQALGKLRCDIAIQEMLEFFDSLEDEVLRSEMALALARIVGEESRYISLWRQLRSDFNTGSAQALLDLRKEMLLVPRLPAKLANIADNASSLLAGGDIDQAVAILHKLIAFMPPDKASSAQRTILSFCDSGLGRQLVQKQLILLTLHTLDAAVRYVSFSNAAIKKVPQDTKTVKMPI
jgi:HEAT repeat protein